MLVCDPTVTTEKLNKNLTKTIQLLHPLKTLFNPDYPKPTNQSQMYLF